jgi:hypothetical protein
VGMSYTVESLLSSQKILCSSKLVEGEVVSVPKHYNINLYGEVKVKCARFL